MLQARLRKWLAREPSTKDVMIGHKVLVLPNVAKNRAPNMRKILEINVS
jgi:hypothetical protein